VQDKTKQYRTWLSQAATDGSLGRLRTDHCRQGYRPVEEVTPGLCQG